MTGRGLRDDPWTGLRARTPARIALGRAGGSMPTAELLRFALDHAEARDAVHAALDTDALAAALRSAGHDVVCVDSQAADLATHLRRPDRGRRLDEPSRQRLADFAATHPRPVDVVLILADGLSATAAGRHGVGLVAELRARLVGLSVGPVVIARHARVALQDEIGQTLGATAAVILLGERPGLGSADSLGAYLVFGPKVGRSDAERNCVSNVRPQGLPLPVAADTIAYLLHAALDRRLSGVDLKDDRPARLTAPARSSP